MNTWQQVDAAEIPTTARAPFPNAAECLHAALIFAGRGWEVLPLFGLDESGRCLCWRRERCEHPGKHPRTRGRSAITPTKDPAAIRKHFKGDLRSNVGVRCGEVLAVLDIDPRNAGDESLALLLREHGELPATPEVATGGGGRHFYFKAPTQAITKCVIASGVDLLVGKANVTAPPSLHGSGRRYVWTRAPGEIALAELPAWIAEAARKMRPSGDGTAAPIESEIRAGERNKTLVSLAGTMRRRGMSAEAIGAALIQENATRCRPPMTEAEVAEIARSVARYEPSDASGVARKHLTDMGNAERLVERHGEDLRYCHPWGKWLAWDGRRWALDATAEVMRRAKESTRSIYAEAASEEDDKGRKAIDKHARESEASKRIKAMVDLATSEPRIPIMPVELDRDPWALNVLNGTIDLRTGELRAHRREDLLTKLVPIEYDPKATAPTFERFLREIMEDNPHLVDYLRRAFGYGSCGNVREHVLFFMHGGGRNGKSTLLNATRDTLGGDYAAEAMPELLLVKQGEAHPTERAHLFGRRFISTVEVEEGRRMAEVLVKQITGGDPITARRMREDPWTFDPTHKIFLAANHKPEIRGTDVAIWSRIHLIPFNVCFKGREDKNLREKLAAERPGILAWLVRGCVEWNAGGLNPPSEVLGATDAYRHEMDPLEDFLADRCITGRDDYRVRAAELYSAYTEWHRCEVGGEPMTQQAFGRRLTERSFRKDRTGGARWWIGLGLRHEEGVTHDAS